MSYGRWFECRRIGKTTSTRFLPNAVCVLLGIVADGWMPRRMSDPITIDVNYDGTDSLLRRAANRIKQSQPGEYSEHAAPA